MELMLGIGNPDRKTNKNIFSVSVIVWIPDPDLPTAIRSGMTEGWFGMVYFNGSSMSRWGFCPLIPALGV